MFRRVPCAKARQWAQRWLDVDKAHTGWNTDALWGHYVDECFPKGCDDCPMNMHDFERWLRYALGEAIAIRPGPGFGLTVDGLALRDSPNLASDE